MKEGEANLSSAQFEDMVSKRDIFLFATEAYLKLIDSQAVKAFLEFQKRGKLETVSIKKLESPGVRAAEKAFDEHPDIKLFKAVQQLREDTKNWSDNT
jgi:hypothetical protein